MGKFIFTVEEGCTADCEYCPFSCFIYGEPICGNPEIEELDCKKYDLRTLKITKQG